MYDGSADPLAWLNGCESIRGQYAANDMEIGYTIFHLIHTAQLQCMHLTGIKMATNPEHANHGMTEYFGRQI
jgi:hypothetical protein